MQIDAAPAEGDPFHFEPEALVEGGVALELDGAAGADDALPGQIDPGVERTDNLAGGTRVSRGFGDGAVGRDVAAWNLADGGEDAFSHQRSRVEDWFHGAPAERWLANRPRGIVICHKAEHLANDGTHPCSPRGGVRYLQFFTGATRWKEGCYEWFRSQRQ